MNLINNYLFKKENNAALVVFRIFFGLLMLIECWGAIATGWVSRTFVEPSFTFTFMGFGWTQFLLGETMYVYYFIMGVLGIGIMLGYKYRLACIGFFLLWGLSYLMQKSSYNNHYYLVWLVSGIMACVPAHTYQSIDAKNNPNLRSLTTPKWVLIAFKLQIALVYIYAAIAKLYPGWYENKFLGIRLNDAAHWFENTMQIPAMATLLRYEPFQYFLTYSGIAFDFLIIPMLLIKKTRKIAFIGLLTFHLMNSIILQIGIFPYFAIAFAIFYFPADYIERLFFRKKRTLTAEKSLATPDNKSKVFITIVLAVYFAIQLFLPIRHWLIPGDVLWTEEGHRLSWRMMLRTKSILHYAQFTVKIPATQTSEPINLFDYVTKSQAGDLSMKPDMIWQFAQYLEKEYQKNGVEDEIEVYVYTKIGVNGSDFYLLADPDVDLTAVNWNYFGHQDWLLDTPAEIK